MLTMGLGMRSEYSRNRMPRPPQKRTTFMPRDPPPAYPPSSRRTSSAHSESLLEPGLAPEVTVLLRAQPVSEPIRRQRHVVVREDLVLLHSARQRAALHQPLWQVSPRAHLRR